jgi:hypothetical protein
VLRYHWVPGLVSVPPSRVQPVELVSGVPPFIAILNPPPTLVLRIGNGPGVPCEARAEGARR